MSKQRYEVLLDYLREQPGKRATLRQIHVDTWIQNVPEACRQAKKKGHNITTERDEKNPKVAYYQLHEEKMFDTGKPVFMANKVETVQLFPTNPNVLRDQDNWRIQNERNEVDRRRNTTNQSKENL